MTNIPAFISAFVTALDGPIAALDARAHDGPPISDEHMDYVAVGYSEEGSAVDAEQRNETLGPGRFEDFDVACEACALSGDNDMKAARAKALALFAAASTVLAGDWTVDGTVTAAAVSRYRIGQYQTKDGAIAVVDFAVSVRITPL